MGRILRLMSFCAGILGLGIILLVAGCGSGGKTRFRLMNAVPDESNLDVLVDSKSVASNLAYGTSTGYLSVGSGSHQVGIESSGSSTTLLQQSIDFGSGSDTTVISSNFSSQVANLVLTDNNSAPASGDFTVRLVNASPNLGPADIYIVTPGTALTTVSPTLSNLGFGATASAYQSLAAASYEIEVTSAGQKFAVIDTGSLTLSAGQSHLRGFEQPSRRIFLRHPARRKLSQTRFQLFQLPVSKPETGNSKEPPAIISYDTGRISWRK